jgi:hypothetical protein
MGSQVISSRFYWLHLYSIIIPPSHSPFVFPSAYFPPFIYLIQKPTHGAPTLHQFSSQLIPSQAKPSLTGAPISVFVHSSQIIIYLFGNCKNNLFQDLLRFFSSLLMTFFSQQRNPCLTWLGNPLSLFHSDIIHEPRVSQNPYTPILWVCPLWKASRTV